MAQHKLTDIRRPAIIGRAQSQTTWNKQTSDNLDIAKSSYEEGIWIPAYTFATGGSVTYSTQLGAWTRMGRLITLEARLTVASTAGSPTGVASLLGLPFAPAVRGGGGAFAVAGYQAGWSTVTGLIAIVIGQGTVVASLVTLTNATIGGPITGANFAVACDLGFSLSYLTGQI